MKRLSQYIALSALLATAFWAGTAWEHTRHRPGAIAVLPAAAIAPALAPADHRVDGDRAVQIAVKYMQEQGYGKDSYRWHASTRPPVFDQKNQNWLVSVEAHPMPQSERKAKTVAALLETGVEVKASGEVAHEPWSIHGW